MLYGHEPHTLKPGQNVLVWGATGGLGVFATQLIKLQMQLVLFLVRTK